MYLKADNPFDAFDELSTYLKAEKKRLELKAEENIQVPVALVNYPGPWLYKFAGERGALNCSLSDYFKKYSYYDSTSEIDTLEALDTRKEQLLLLIAKMQEDIGDVKRQNEPLIAHNIKIQDKIKLIMQQIGIKDSYSVRDLKSRSMNPKWIRYQAGYLTDLTRDIPTIPKGWSDTGEIKKNVMASYERVKAKIVAAQREEEKKKQAAIDAQELALLRAKYTPDNAFSCKDEIMEALLSKNKYLMLAYYLELNRGDWNDGYDYANTGLSGFTVETTLDEEIYKDIEACIRQGDDDGYIDGRIFRDCEYNYGVLYGMVKDEALMKDFEKIKEIIS